tara:strand:- start:493 stop:1368 length:876 start_codon:yes stop_codon:yes gene_type:complete
MPYIQSWGISRSKSPFNALQSPLKNDQSIMTENVEEDENNPATTIIEENNEKANETFNWDKIPVTSKPSLSLSQERADEIGSEFKRREEGDSAWDQLGTLLSNPFQGIMALGNQTAEGVRSFFGNPTNKPTRSDALANLTNLAIAKEGEKTSGQIDPELFRSNLFNNTLQWQPHIVAGSSAHQVFTGGGQTLTGDFKQGGKNIVGGAFSYIPGVKQMRKMGGVGGFSQKFDKFTGPMIANVRPFVDRFTTNFANKIDSNKFSQATSTLLDKGGTYSYKLNKAKKQTEMKSS